MHGFLAGKTLSANQIEFVNLIGDYLTQRGLMVRHLSMSRRLLISAQKVWRAFSILETSRALQRFQLSANMRTCDGAQGDGDMNQNTSFDAVFFSPSAVEESSS